MSFIVNPGSGPVPNGTEANARTNMDAFVADVSATGTPVTLDPNVVGEDDGRFIFTVNKPDGETVEVEMPGIPLAEVRYMGEKDQNIWDFPRLYVNGSSWVWMYAIDAVTYVDPDKG